MKTKINGSPSFAYLDVKLEAGESIISESDAMSTMSADLDMKAQLNGSFFAALAKKFLGGESLFINTYSNNGRETKSMTLAQTTPGDMIEYSLNKNSLCLQPGAFIASDEKVSLGLSYAGILSFIAREGLFKLVVSGSGKIWFGSYGGIIEKDIDGEYIVDTSHLVAYEPQLNMKMQLPNGFFGSFFSGEGLVTRIEGKGKIWIQSRSMSGLVSWLNPKL